MRRVGQGWGLALAVALGGCGGGARTAPPAPAAGSIAAAAFADADTLRVTEVAPGVHHLYAWDGRGPWAIHVLEIDVAACRPAIEARKAGPRLDGRARTSELGAGALAAINADFFALPGGTPVGAHVSGGEVLIGPGPRPVVAFGAGGPWIGRAELRGFVARGADTLRLAGVNRPAGAVQDDALLFTAWYGETSPSDSGAAGVRVAVLSGTATDGMGVVVDRDTIAGALPLDGGTVVVRGGGAAGRWLAGVRVGDTLAWHAVVVKAGAVSAPGAEEAVGGFPALVRGGEPLPDIAEGVTPAFGENRHPRTAVGWTAGGRRHLWVVVDGRQAPYSDGMSLAELAGLMQRLGAEEAINLDGGGSTAMVVAGRVVNRPSDRTGERPVGNALVLAGCRAASAARSPYAVTPSR